VFEPVRAGHAVALVAACGRHLDHGICLRPLDPPSSFRFEVVWSAGVTSAVVVAFVETSSMAVADEATRLVSQRLATSGLDRAAA
jgi:hypothetical protein